MKYFFLLLCIYQSASCLAQKQHVAGQPCENADFEYGMLTNWDCYTGYYGNARQTYQPNPGVLSPLRHEIVSGLGTDPFSGLPKVCPTGGAFSCKLGNSNTGGEAEVIEQTFLVTNNNKFFNYKFAPVLQDAGGWLGNEPYFKASMINANNVVIPCGYLNVQRGTLPGMHTFNGGIYWDWQSNTVDLSSYVGQNITVRFETADESQGGRFGYAYIDGSCLSGQSPIEINDSLCSGESVTLTSPASSNILWNTGDTTQSIIINAPGLYWNQGTSLTGCPLGRYYRYVTQSPDPTASYTYSTNCSRNVSFTNTSTVANPAVINSWNWNFGDGAGSSNQQHPTYSYNAPGDYIVTLVVQTNLGCTDSVLTNVHVMATPVAAFTSEYSKCVDQSLQFTNLSAIVADTIVQYYWDFGDGSPPANSRNSSHTYTIPGSYTVMMICTSDLNCSDTAYGPVIIYHKPQAAFSGTAGCVNSPMAFTDLSTVVGGNITNRTWDFGDGSPPDHGQNPSHTYLSVGNYMVTLIAGSNFGCSDTISSAVTIYLNPVARFTATAVCQGNSTLFTNISTFQPGNAVVGWEWDFGDGSPHGTNQNENHIYSTHGTYSVTLTVTTVNGCTNAANMTVVVYPLPIVNFSFPGNCQSSLVYFSDHSTIANGASIVQYNWDFGDGTPHSNLVNPVHSYASLGTFNVTLTLTSDAGCTASLTQSVIITQPKPKAAFTTGNTFCNQDPLSFFDQSSQINGYITARKWNFGDGSPVDTNQNPTHIFALPGSYNVLLIVTGSAGCIDIDSSYQMITILENPVVNFTTIEQCEGNLVQFIDGSNIGGGVALNYDWDYGDGSPHNYIKSPFHIYSQGTYTVTLTVNAPGGCSRSISKQVDSYAQQVADFSFAGLCKGQLTYLTDQTTIANGSITYWDWDLGDNWHDYTQNPSHIYPGVGNYKVFLTTRSNGGCQDTISKTISISTCVGIEENTYTCKVSHAYIVSSEQLLLQFINAGISTRNEISIVNMLGQLVHIEFMHIPQGNSNVQISTTGWPKGVYMTRIVNDGASYTYKFTKE
jgi:PKD repeat protein